MGGPEVDESVDRVVASVLGQGLGDDLHRVGEGVDGHLLPSAHGGGVGLQVLGDLHRRGTAARDVLAVDDHVRHHAQGIVEGAVSLGHHVLGPAPDEDGDGHGVLAAGDEGEGVLAELPLLDGARSAQVLLRDLLQVVDDPGAGGLGQLLHVGLLDPADGEDAVLGQVVLGQVVDALLAEHHVGASVLEVVHHTLEGGLLLVQEGLEREGVVDLDLGVHLGLLDLQGLVDQGDLRVLLVLGHAHMGRLLVDDDALDELGVADGTALLLDDLDVVDVRLDTATHLLDDRQHGVHGQVGQELHATDGLRCHRGEGNLLEELPVLQVLDLEGVPVQDALRFGGRHSVAVCYDRGVHGRVEKVLGLLQ